MFGQIRWAEDGTAYGGPGLVALAHAYGREKDDE
jgi:hypothetical protein